MTPNSVTATPPHSTLGRRVLATLLDLLLLGLLAELIGRLTQPLFVAMLAERGMSIGPGGVMNNYMGGRLAAAMASAVIFTMIIPLELFLGRSPGKWVLRLAVGASGGAPSGAQLVVRAMAKWWIFPAQAGQDLADAADAFGPQVPAWTVSAVEALFAITYLIVVCGYVVAFLRADGRALHDLIAGTRVMTTGDNEERGFEVVGVTEDTAATPVERSVEIR